MVQKPFNLNLFFLNGGIIRMTCGIYKITNKITGCEYIGASSDIERRWMRHKSELRGNYHHNYLLQKSWNKYEEHDFKFEIIETCNKDELLSREQYYVELYNTEIPNGYNLTPGGDGINTTGFYHVINVKLKNATDAYAYIFYDHGETYRVQSMFIETLEEKVKNNGWDWFVVDEEKANQTILENQKKKSTRGYNNNSGYFRVSKVKANNIIGYIWAYHAQINGEHIRVSNMDLDKLKIKVEEKELPWFIVNSEKAKISDDLNKSNKKVANNFYHNKTGFYRVSKSRSSYVYIYSDNLKKQHRIYNTDINELEQIVKVKGLPWKIIDEDLAEKTLNQSRSC